jgi:hypothetical protein
MAIQEIELTPEGSDKTGFKKEINEGAQQMMFDIVQISLYTKPEESTVRELASNAVDAQREKEIAIKILRDGEDPSKYFIKRDGAKYKDSNWTPEYYDLTYLDHVNNHIDIEYHRGEGGGYSDKFVVRDYGIGIGPQRLVGYFQLGYSTKRNNTSSLGAFGLGNKVPLSTRCDYYTVITVYNGKKFKFNVYSKKIESIVPKFDTETNYINDSIVLSNGMEVYYEDCNEKNYTEIVTPTKAFNRSKYEAAVKSQLLYFQNVNFTVIESNDYRRNVDFHATVKYHSDKLVVSSNSQFSKPHILITKGEGSDENVVGVCYGYIDFEQMELNQLYGNVGIKCTIRSVVTDDHTGKETVIQEGVEVSPSRESVIWSEYTKDFLKQRFLEAADEATVILQSKLNVDNFIDWLQACKDIRSSMSGDPTLRELSKIINTQDLSPQFQNTSIRYWLPDTIFRGFKVRVVSKEYNVDKKKDILKRTPLTDWAYFNKNVLYLKKDKTQPKKDAYLRHMHQNNFITIEEMTDEEIVSKYKMNDVQSRNLGPIVYAETFAPNGRRDQVKKLLLASGYLKSYEDVVIPEDWDKKLDDEGEEIKVEPIKPPTAAELRKLNQAIPVHVLCPLHYVPWNSTKHFKWAQFDEKIKDFIEYEGEIVYGFNADDEKLHFLGSILGAQYTDAWPSGMIHCDSDNIRYNNKDFRIIKISKQNERHIKANPNARHIDDFFQETTYQDGISTS